MVDATPAAGPVIVELPAELDVSNSGALAMRLRAVISPGAGVGVVVADMSTTSFCDSSGTRVLVLARNWASADGVELRLVAPPGPTLAVLELMGLDRLLPVYPALREALAAGPAPGRSSDNERASGE